jgi:hypothetical protein
MKSCGTHVLASTVLLLLLLTPGAAAAVDYSFNWEVTGTGTETYEAYWSLSIARDYQDADDGWSGKVTFLHIIVTPPGWDISGYSFVASINSGIYSYDITVEDDHVILSGTVGGDWPWQRGHLKFTFEVSYWKWECATVTYGEGDKDMGAFNACPTAQHGGTVSGVTYSLTDDSEYVDTWLDGGHVCAQVINTAVCIDIKPGSDPNAINPKSKGLIPVAILTTDDFDAADVDPDTVEFGPNGATKAHEKVHLEDVDGDGDKDLLLHFNCQETGIAAGDTEVLLTGKKYDGYHISGVDSIKTAGN